MTLLQSLNDSSSSAPKAKRRKLEHPESPERPSEEEDGGENRPEDVDQVDEEEDPAIGLDEQPDDGSDSEDEDAVTDPFDVHFAHPDELAIAKGVKAVKDGEWATKRALIQSLRATMLSPGTELSFDAPQPASGLDDFNLKQKLKETAGKKMAKLDEAQKAVMPLLFDYRDIFHCGRTVANSNSLRQAVCLHALNHVFK